MLHAVSPSFNESERRELFGIFYQAVKDALDVYDEQMNRQLRRIHAVSQASGH